MNWLLSIVLEMLASAVVLIPVYLMLNKTHFRNGIKSISYCIFSFYLVAVYALVGMPNVTYVRFELAVNWLPIVGMITDLRSNLLNVLLFVPLGVMLPLGWQKYRAGKNTLLFGLGMSLFIEILQIFTFRATDINDLLTNTFGTLLGFAIANQLIKKYPAIKGVGNEKNDNELYIVCAIVFVVMFFIQPFIFSFIWDMIY